MSVRILIVDDDQKVRELLRRFLEPEGYGVFEAVSAEQAVDMVESLQPARRLLRHPHDRCKRIVAG